MKILVKNSNNLVLYQFANDVTVTLESNKVVTPDFHILDLNSSNCTLVTGVSEKADFNGGKYKWESDDWADNDDWVSPLERQITLAEEEVTRLKALR